MVNIVVYYHDPVEVDRSTSWTGLCPNLNESKLVNISTVTNPQVTKLFEYTQPDVVIAVDEKPVLSIEQSQMNPSGHNIPQRFSFHVRASELGVPSILYYPEYSRRTFSDPNVRYAQIRVPMAQLRLSSIYGVPALSMFWPMDPQTLLPDMGRYAHVDMAGVVNSIITNVQNGGNFLDIPEVKSALARMKQVISKYAQRYRRNTTVRKLLPDGFLTAATESGNSIDPPGKAKLFTTEQFLSSTVFSSLDQTSTLNEAKERLRRHKLTMVFTGTANASKTDSEHPWPGYLTLLDILYLRTDVGHSPKDRSVNLIYELPVSLPLFVSRINQKPPPTATYIVDTFADMILLKGGVVPGRTIRGNVDAIPIPQS